MYIIFLFLPVFSFIRLKLRRVRKFSFTLFLSLSKKTVLKNPCREHSFVFFSYFKVTGLEKLKQ